MKEAALNILGYLPVRSVAEITFVMQLIQGIAEKRIQEACANALRRARGDTPEKTAALEAGKVSSVEAVREAVEYVLS